LPRIVNPWTKENIRYEWLALRVILVIY